MRAPNSKKHIRNFILTRDDNKCLICGTELNLTLDHIVPKSLGGKMMLSNLQTLCYHCNLSKGTRVVDLRQVKIVGKIDLPDLPKNKKRRRNLTPILSKRTLPFDMWRWLPTSANAIRFRIITHIYNSADIANAVCDIFCRE